MSELLNTKLSIDKSTWIKVKLGDVVTEPRDTVKDFTKERIDHVVGLEHIDAESIHLRRSANMDNSTTFTKKFKVGDVLFGRRRAYLKKAVQAKFSGICSGDITVMRVKKDLLPELLPFVINNEKFFDYAVKHSAGGLSPRVKFKDLANYEFLLPPKDQQAKLAELLWAMDEVVENQIKNVERINNLYQRVLFDFFENDSVFTKKTLGAFVDIRSGESPSFFEFLSSGDRVPFYKVKDLNESIKYQYYVKEWVNPIKNKLIPLGSIIFPKRGEAIMTNKVRIVIENCHIDTNTMALTVIDNIVLNNEFLYYFLYYKKLFKIADTSQIPQINNVHIIPYPINLPPIEIQLNLIKKLNKILRTIELTNLKILSSKALQKSLINQIF